MMMKFFVVGRDLENAEGERGQINLGMRSSPTEEVDHVTLALSSWVGGSGGFLDPKPNCSQTRRMD
jgi:hypothetical protein